MEEDIQKKEESTNESTNQNVDLGTFRDVEALKKSYDSLRGEFTRKSQELAKLQKTLGDKETIVTPPSAVNEGEDNSALNEDLPFLQNEKWQKDVDEFFRERNITDEQKRELAQMLIQDKEVQSSSSPLYVAYAKMLEKNAKNMQELSKDEEFLEKYIFSNENIKNKIIKDYVYSLNNHDSIPKIMPELVANFGETHTTPKTLNEAKILAQKYFD